MAFGVAIALGALVVLGRVVAAASAEQKRNRIRLAWARLPAWDGKSGGPVRIDGRVREHSPLAIDTAAGTVAVRGPFDVPGDLVIDRAPDLQEKIFPRGTTVRLFGVVSHAFELDARGVRAQHFTVGPLAEGATGVERL